MGLPGSDPTLIKKRHGTYIKFFVSNSLRGIAYYIEWAVKFILYLVLHSVDVLEALTGVLLQVFRVIRILIKTIFTFGHLLRFIGRSLGAEGSFLFVLCLFTYFCFWREDGSVVSAVSDVFHIKMCMVAVCVWAITIPIGGLLVFVRVRRKIYQQIDLLENYDKLYENESGSAGPTIQATDSQAITRDAFADVGTETEWTIPEPLEVEIPSKDPFPSERASEHDASSPSEGTGNDEKASRGKAKESLPRLTSRTRTRERKKS